MNAAHFIPGLDGKIIDRPLCESFGNEAVHALRNRFSLLRDAEGVARLFSLQPAGASGAIDIMMHRVGSEIIIEGHPRGGQESGDPIGLVRELARRLDAHPGRSDFLQEAARQLRALTGFESVTLFQYDGEGGAAMAAHCARGELPPAVPPSTSDFGLRFISQCDEPPVAISPSAELEFLNGCFLRAPTDSERAEMGSAVSMLRLPLHAGNELLGIAICVDRTPRQISLERIAAAELLADLVALRLAILDRR